MRGVAYSWPHAVVRGPRSPPLSLYTYYDAASRFAIYRGRHSAIIIIQSLIDRCDFAQIVPAKSMSA